MNNKDYEPLCGLCNEIVYILDKDELLTKENESYRINVAQGYLYKYIENVLKKCDLCNINNNLIILKNYFEKNKGVWKNSQCNMKNFLKKTDCELKEIINKDLEYICNAFIENESIEIFDFYYIQTIVELHLPRCVNCSSCLAFISNLEIVVKLLNKTMTIDDAKKENHVYKLADISDRLIAEYIKSPQMEFNIAGSYFKNKDKLLVYLDSNIIMEYEKDASFWKIIQNSKDCHDYYYSPSHLEDILKRKQSEKDILDIIMIFTESRFIHRVNTGVRFHYESPHSSYKRVDTDTSKSISSITEDYKIEKITANGLYYPEYNTTLHKIKINNKILNLTSVEFINVFDQINPQFTLNDIRNMDLQKTEYNYLNYVIHTLVNVMDVLNYKSEKETKKIRTSVHDIEHLIYAAYSDIFVTLDTKLLNRSKSIYNHIVPNIRVMNIDEFMKHVTNR